MSKRANLEENKTERNAGCLAMGCLNREPGGEKNNKRMRAKSTHKRRKKSRVVHVGALRLKRCCGRDIKNSYGLDENLGKEVEVEDGDTRMYIRFFLSGVRRLGSLEEARKKSGLLVFGSFAVSGQQERSTTYHWRRREETRYGKHRCDCKVPLPCSGWAGVGLARWMRLVSADSSRSLSMT